MLIVGGEVEGRRGIDVRIEDGVVAEVGAGLARQPGEPVIAAAGGAVLPGLHDHHVHLRALAAARGSVEVGPPRVTGPAAFDGRLRAAARAVPPGGWVRAVGYHESVAGPLDRHRLDAAVADRPVRVQHRSGALWVLNTAALVAAGVLHPTPGRPRPTALDRTGGPGGLDGPSGLAGTGRTAGLDGTGGPGRTGGTSGLGRPGGTSGLGRPGGPGGPGGLLAGTGGAGRTGGTGGLAGTGGTRSGTGAQDVERDEHGVPTVGRGDDGQELSRTGGTSAGPGDGGGLLSRTIMPGGIGGAGSGPGGIGGTDGSPTAAGHGEAGAPCGIGEASGDTAVGGDVEVEGIERDEHGEPTGRLWRLDRWLAGRIPPSPLDLVAVGRAAAERGVTGFTDADPSRAQADVDLLIAGELPQRLVLMSSAGLDLGRRSAGADDPWCTAGPRKLLLDDATLPPLDDLATWMAAAHADGEPVAVHCVTRLQLVATVAALAQAGAAPGDRIEHGAVVPTELHGDLRRLGVTVVTQPNFVAERGDQYRTDVDADDLPVLYPCASLQAAGIAVAAGTDAPFGDADPWAAVRAAVHRRTPAGAVLGPGERIDPATALALFLGRPGAPAVRRRVEPGAPADLCVLDRPLAALHATLAAHEPALLDPVALTLVAGHITADRR